MGEYSPNQRFWLIGETDLVNVDQDLNYNLTRVDYRMRTLVEYMKTDIASISDSSLVKEPGMKWYKTYTNSIWYCHEGTNIVQDPNAYVDSWTASTITYESGFQSLDQGENRIAYSSFGGQIRLRGKLIRSGLAAFTKNTATDVFSLPPAILPDDSRYFFVHMGEGISQFQVARVFIPGSGSADLRCEVIVYGQDGLGSNNNFISLNDINYNISD